MRRLAEFFEEAETGKLSHTRLAFFFFTVLLVILLFREAPVPMEFYALYAAIGGLKVWQRFAERIPERPSSPDTEKVIPTKEELEKMWGQVEARRAGKKEGGQ